jgi:hypothetical protein
MDCEQIKREELLEKYLADRLQPEAQDAVETHILECSGCVQELEARLLLRSELTLNAGEIRTKTVEKFSFFRWQALALASVLVALLGGGYAGFHSGLFSKHAGGQASLTAQSTNPPNSSPGNDSVPKTIARPTEAGEANTAKNETAGHGAGKLPSEKANETAPAAPDSHTTTSPANSNSNMTLEPGPIENLHKPETASLNPGVKSSSALTTEQGVELFKLGQVQAAPYAFTGFTSKGEPPGGKPSTGFSGQIQPATAGRAKFQKAMNSYVAGKYAEAADLLSDDAELEPQAADTHFYLGVCRILLGHVQDSVEPLQRAIAAGKTPYLQSSHYYLAKAYVQTSQLDKATRELQLAVSTPGRLTTESKQFLIKVQALRTSIEKK